MLDRSFALDEPIQIFEHLSRRETTDIARASFGYMVRFRKRRHLPPIGRIGQGVAETIGFPRLGTHPTTDTIHNVSWRVDRYRHPPAARWHGGNSLRFTPKPPLRRIGLVVADPVSKSDPAKAHGQSGAVLVVAVAALVLNASPECESKREHDNHSFHESS
jgi:hypothetical protein